MEDVSECNNVWCRSIWTRRGWCMPCVWYGASNATGHVPGPTNDDWSELESISTGIKENQHYPSRNEAISYSTIHTSSDHITDNTKYTGSYRHIQVQAGWNVFGTIVSYSVCAQSRDQIHSRLFFQLLPKCISWRIKHTEHDTMGRYSKSPSHYKLEKSRTVIGILLNYPHKLRWFFLTANLFDKNHLTNR